MKNNIYLDIHVIQNLPPSNVNRDDTGSPKTAQYGGVTRARVSSQSWKKAIRDYFKANNISIGYRSKKLAKKLAEKIVILDKSIKAKDAEELSEKTLKIALAKNLKSSEQNKVFENKKKNEEIIKILRLFFLSHHIKLIN